MSAEGMPLQRMQTVVVQELAQAAPVRRMYLADDSVAHMYETSRCGRLEDVASWSPMHSCDPCR